MSINTKETNMTKETKTPVDISTLSMKPTSMRLGKEIGESEMRLNQLEARLDSVDMHIKLLMKDREAAIRLLHGRMNNEVGLQEMIHGWKNA